ncbi:MAG: TonB-dependent receptor [Ignavibacteria bacterium]|nr:TonB-dependent receptor [Ignavibacteria bacterium]
MKNSQGQMIDSKVEIISLSGMNGLKIKNITVLFSILLILLINFSVLYSEESKGIISGEIIDADTKQPLSYVTVTVQGTKLGAISDKNGYYVIKKVPVGNYVVNVSRIEYQKSEIPDVNVSVGRNQTVNFELKHKDIIMGSILVTNDYFQKPVDNPTSFKSLEPQEIRRSPGSADDIFRVMQSLPGVSTAGGKSAQLIVRGGSPDENLTLLDNVEIYNPIHFARSGESMGIISVINPSLLKKVDFITGGFPSKYGDKLSSVFDMSLMDGNKEVFNTDVNLNLGGFGLTLDGPVTEKSSVIFSLRRGFFDILTSIMNKPAAPRYYDAVGKYTIHLNDMNKLSIVGFYYIDQIDKEGTINQNPEMNKYPYMTRDDYGSAFGINWQSLFSTNAYALTTFSYSSNGWKTHLGLENNRDLKGDDIQEDEYILKTEVNYKPLSWIEFKTGGYIKFIDSKHVIWSPEDTTRNGKLIPASSVSYHPEISEKYSGFIQTSMNPISVITLNTGLRLDHFTYTGETKLSPRISFKYNIFENTAFNLAYGDFYQTPAAFQIAVDTNNHSLKSAKSTHYVIGFEHNFYEDMKASVEVYHKELNNVITTSDTNNILTNSGNGYTRGIEFYLQKKFTQGFVGSISYSYSTSKRQDGVNLPEYNFEYDRPHILNIIFGIELPDSWQIGAKFQYATGNPYTSYKEAKQGINGIYYIVDGEKNAARYPDYHKLDLRVDKKFQFDSWSINVYLDLWNVYNRINVMSYSFSVDNAGNINTKIREDFGLLPLIGINILF